jgi:hypothetical protein
MHQLSIRNYVIRSEEEVTRYKQLLSRVVVWVQIRIFPSSSKYRKKNLDLF